jgi:hypothetical protein
MEIKSARWADLLLPFCVADWAGRRVNRKPLQQCCINVLADLKSIKLGIMVVSQAVANVAIFYPRDLFKVQ